MCLKGEVPLVPVRGVIAIDARSNRKVFRRHGDRKETLPPEDFDKNAADASDPSMQVTLGKG